MAKTERRRGQRRTDKATVATERRSNGERREVTPRIGVTVTRQGRLMDKA